MKYSTVSAKIDPELKEKIARYNISVSKVIKKALEDEVRRREDEEMREMLKEASKILSKVGGDNITQFIREGREER